MWINIDEAVITLETSRRTLHRRILGGQIKSKKDGKRRLVWIDEHKPEPIPSSLNPDETENLKSQNEQLNKDLRQMADKLSQMADNATEERRRHDLIILQLTQQLDQARLQIEDLTLKQTYWQRLKSVFGF